MNNTKSVDVGNVWWFWFTTSAFTVDKRLRRIFRILPHDPRCKFCNAPFQGMDGTIVWVLFGKERSALNPRFCNLCDLASREFPGGAEVEMAMLFADVRGSTALSEKMRPVEFSNITNVFRRVPQLIDWAADLPASMRQLIDRLLENMKVLDRQVKELEARLKAWHQGSELSRKLEKIPGIGPLAASALVASIADARSFKNGRQVAACWGWCRNRIPAAENPSCWA